MPWNTSLVRELSMTQRYMHLNPAALDQAIGLLDSPEVLPRRGGIGETASGMTGRLMFRTT